MPRSIQMLFPRVVQAKSISIAISTIPNSNPGNLINLTGGAQIHAPPLYFCHRTCNPQPKLAEDLFFFCAHASQMKFFPIIALRSKILVRLSFSNKTEIWLLPTFSTLPAPNALCTTAAPGTYPVVST